MSFRTKTILKIIKIVVIVGGFFLPDHFRAKKIRNQKNSKKGEKREK